MAQRQFKYNDTSPWIPAFGDGSSGDLTLSSSGTLGASSLAYWNTFTGTAGQSTGTLGSNLTWNGPVLIHQFQKTGVGIWELNWAIVSASTSVTLLYPLINTYTAGAQMITIGQFNNINITSGTTITVPSWNGSTGGLAVLMCRNTITLAGSLTAAGAGYRGGAGASSTNSGGYRGETYDGNGYNAHSQSAYLSAGGGGFFGSGAGYNGDTIGQTDSTLVTKFISGGAGGGGNSNNGSGGIGGAGGGVILLISPNITVTGAVNANGGNGAIGQNSMGAGGAGAGGSILLKGQVINLGTSLVTAIGGTTNTALADPGGVGAGATKIAGQGASGKQAGTGVIHIDYQNNITNTTTSPTYSSTQDYTLVSALKGGNYAFFM